MKRHAFLTGSLVVAGLLAEMVLTNPLAAADLTDKQGAAMGRATVGLLDCTSATPIVCGDRISDNNGNGASNAADYSCAGGATGPELVYELTLTTPTEVSIVLRPSTCDLDLFLLDACDESACIAWSALGGTSGETVLQTLGAGIYYVVVDGFAGASCDFDLELECTEGLFFEIEAPDVSSVGFDPSLALDSAGVPHIAHFDANFVLKYSSRTNGFWTTETVDPTTGTTDRFCSLAIDRTDTPHIAYVDPGATGGLFYAVRGPSGWTGEAVAGLVSASTTQISLAVDDTGVPSIVFSDGPRLFYTLRLGGLWLQETIDSGTPGQLTGVETSLVLDSARRPHVAYAKTEFTGSPQELRYARRLDESWIIEVVASVPGAVFFDLAPSLVLDEARVPHLSYIFATDDIYYARRAEGTWFDTLIRPAGSSPGLPRRTALVLDGTGQPIVASPASTRGDAAVAIDHPVDSGWINQPVGIGTMPSMARDSSGNLHVAIHCDVSD